MLGYLSIFRKVDASFGEESTQGSLPGAQGFKALPRVIEDGDQQNNLLGDPGKLTKLLQYHIVPGLYTADDMLDHIFLKTLEGQRLRVWADIYETPLGEEEITTGSDAYGYIVQDTVTTAMQESIKINGAHVIVANVSADNGVMHIIDKVLVPQFMML